MTTPTAETASALREIAARLVGIGEGGLAQAVTMSAKYMATGEQKMVRCAVESLRGLAVQHAASPAAALLNEGVELASREVTAELLPCLSKRTPRSPRYGSPNPEVIATWLGSYRM